MKTDLAECAKAAGIENVQTVQAADAADALQTALDGDKMTVLVVKCESGNIKVPVITMDPVVIRDRFMKTIAARNG